MAIRPRKLKVAHVHLASQHDLSSQQLAILARGLSGLNVDQHAVVRCQQVAEQLSRVPYVTIGPLVSSPIVANCLLPCADICHAHDARSAQTGLLLTLTRSIPFILSYRSQTTVSDAPITKAINRRSRAIVCASIIDQQRLLQDFPESTISVIANTTGKGENGYQELEANRLAAQYLDVYCRALECD